MGGKMAKDPALLQRFVDLFHECDPEQGFKDPIKALATIGEMTLRGKRRIYDKVRGFLYPFVDEAMENVVARAKVESGVERQHESSVLASLASNWYHRQTKGNVEDVLLARTCIANDMFTFSSAALSNSFGMAAWIVYHYLKDTNGLPSVLKAELMNPENQSTNTYPQFEKMMLEIGRLNTPGDFHRNLKVDWPLPSNPQVVIPKGTNMLISALTIQRKEFRFPKVARD